MKRIDKVKLGKKIIKRDPNRLPPPTPVGEMITEEFLKSLEWEVSDLADKMGYDPRIVQNIIEGSWPINANDAYALGEALNTTPEFWINIQKANDAYAIQQGTNRKR